MSIKVVNYFDEKLLNSLDEDKLICVPTDTIYGLCCNAFSKAARENLIKIKGRDENKPISIVFSSLEEAEKYVEFDENSYRVANRFLPGKITMVVKAKNTLPNYLVSKDGTIGFRICNERNLNLLLKHYKKPLLLTSVNRSNQQPINDINLICEEFKNEVEFLLTSCSYIYNKDNSKDEHFASTVCSFANSTCRVLREGKVTSEKIEKVYNRLDVIKNIFVGSDHGGFDCKNELINNLMKQGFNVVDCGTYSKDSCDYPDFAEEVCAKVLSNENSRGILICTTGEGMFITANKVKGIRCGMGYNEFVSERCVEHNNCNVISFGAKPYYDDEINDKLLSNNCLNIQKFASMFVNADFEGGRHQRRVEKFTKLEK